MGAYLVPRGDALAFFRAQSSFGDELASIRIPAAILREQNNRRSGVDCYIRTNDDLEPYFPRLHMRAHDTVDAVAVRERERGQAKPIGFIHELIGMARAFEKRKITLAPERNVERHGHVGEMSEKLKRLRLRFNVSAQPSAARFTGRCRLQRQG